MCLFLINTLLEYEAEAEILWRHLVDKLLDRQVVWTRRSSDVMHDVCDRAVRITESLEYGFGEDTV